MGRFSLDTIDVAQPCPAEWDSMTGDDQRRFCRQCGKDVHNLSAMTEGAIERLLDEDANRCVRFYRAEDGAIWTAGRIPTAPVSRRALLAIALGGAIGLMPRSARARQRKKPEPAKPAATRQFVTLKSLLEGRRVTTMTYVLTRRSDEPRNRLVGLNEESRSRQNWIGGVIRIAQPGFKEAAEKAP